jgi:uncharacterized protein DUF6165
MSASRPLNLMVPVSLGELADKLTILGIKRVRIKDPEGLKNVEREYGLLLALWNSAAPGDTELCALRDALQAINQTLWKIEDDIRDHERRGDFGPEFVELARAVYRTNDSRSAIKRKINQLFNSEIVEEKSYSG